MKPLAQLLRERIEEKKAYAWDALQHGFAIRALAALRGAAGNAAYICRSGFGRHYACWCCTIQRGAHRGEMT